MYSVCEDCGENLEILYTEVLTALKQEHTFINGCCDCGYVDPEDPYSSVAYLPDSLNVIGEEALLNISARTVVIPDGATSIGARAFARCANLEYVVIPDSVTSIADNAFEGSDVTFICSAGSTAASYAQSKGIPMK